MFLPIRTDRRLKRTPWLNYSLIAINVLIFLLTRQQIEASQRLVAMGGGGSFGQLVDMFPVLGYYLHPAGPRVLQFISYQFLHASWAHLLGNMLFLYVFGNGVEDRLGKVGYLFFYLAGGVFAGLGHVSVAAQPVLGASGSVAAVTGAFLALFPLSNVTIVYWFIIIGAFEIPSILLILFRVGQDVVFQFLGIGDVAYLAHIAGYLYGFLIGFGLLSIRFLPREPYDMLSLIERRKRRTEFRRMTRRGHSPWEYAGPGESGGDTPEIDETQRLRMEQRAQIGRSLSAQNLPEAAKKYRALLQQDASQVMGQQAQLDIANQLMSEGSYDAAAHAYELFLRHYGSYPHREQVELILGLIYARYLARPDRARELLETAKRQLTGSDRELAEKVLAELG
ncbi:MAG: rhomboid family intramembrane serine protease [Phycisphaeraceae bacterium]